MDTSNLICTTNQLQSKPNTTKFQDVKFSQDFGQPCE